MPTDFDSKLQVRQFVQAQQKRERLEKGKPKADKGKKQKAKAKEQSKPRQQREQQQESPEREPDPNCKACQGAHRAHTCGKQGRRSASPPEKQTVQKERVEVAPEEDPAEAAALVGAVVAQSVAATGAHESVALQAGRTAAALAEGDEAAPAAAAQEPEEPDDGASAFAAAIQAERALAARQQQAQQENGRMGAAAAAQAGARAVAAQRDQTAMIGMAVRVVESGESGTIESSADGHLIVRVGPNKTVKKRSHELAVDTGAGAASKKRSHGGRQRPKSKPKPVTMPPWAEPAQLAVKLQVLSKTKRDTESEIPAAGEEAAGAYQDIVGDLHGHAPGAVQLGGEGVLPLPRVTTLDQAQYKGQLGGASPRRKGKDSGKAEFERPAKYIAAQGRRSYEAEANSSRIDYECDAQDEAWLASPEGGRSAPSRTLEADDHLSQTEILCAGGGGGSVVGVKELEELVDFFERSHVREKWIQPVTFEVWATRVLGEGVRETDAVPEMALRPCYGHWAARRREAGQNLVRSLRDL